MGNIHGPRTRGSHAEIQRMDTNGESTEARTNPHYRALSGNTERAKRARNELQEKLTEAVRNETCENTWESLCKIAERVSMEVLGLKPKPHPIPWLKGRERDKEALEAEVGEATLR